MNVEQLKKAISEAFEKATEALEVCVNEIGEAANEILEETKEEFETWEPSGVIHASIGDIANEDYYEIQEDGTKKTEFTWDEAMEIEKKTNGKWRLPTIFEWDKLVAEFGDKDGELDRAVFVKALNLTEDEGGYGNYWAATRYSGANYAYYLYFYLYYVGREIYGRSGRNSVRLVRGEE